MTRYVMIMFKIQSVFWFSNYGTKKKKEKYRAYIWMKNILTQSNVFQK